MYVTFTINIPQMLAYIPYMDPMGYTIIIFPYHLNIPESSHRACAAVAFLARPAVDAVDVGAREEVEGWGLRISWWHLKCGNESDVYIYNYT